MQDVVTMVKNIEAVECVDGLYVFDNSIRKQPIRRQKYGQAERPISTGQLNVLLRLHLPPIKVVVFDRPSYTAAAVLGDLILG